MLRESEKGEEKAMRGSSIRRKKRDYEISVHIVDKKPRFTRNLGSVKKEQCVAGKGGLGTEKQRI